MENQEKTTFSLDDNPQDEIVEEEVIDRDEEYDVDDDDDEEDYDDEEYDDEEDYDDEDYDDEEDYDDGYNDDYYDDRLNKVLDEIAELKRGMQAPSTVVQQPPMPVQPQYIYQPQPMPSVPSAGSEVVMYNEISRLRDELAKNQSSLEMQKELTRIKEDMARDQKFAESQYNAEIKRLQDRIDDLLKNASSPQNEQQPASSQTQDTARFEGEKTLDFDKLLTINESILRAMRDSDAHIRGEIAQLKKQLEEFPSMEELNRAIGNVKKSAHGAECALNGDTVMKLASDIAAVRSAVQSGAPAVASSAVPPVVINEGTGGDIDASELLRQLYDIKSVLGSSSAAAVKRAQTIGDLVNDFKKVNFDVQSQTVSFKDKLASVFGYAKKLGDCNEQDAVDLIKATNAIISELASVNVDKDVFNDLVAYCNDNGDKSITPAMRDSAERFFNITEKLADAEVDDVGDYLPDLLAEKNTLQNNKREEENNALFSDITDAFLDDSRDDDAIKDKIAELAEIKVGDIIDLPLIPAPKAYKAVHSVSDDTIFTKLAEIKAAIAEVSNAAAQAAEAEADAESDEKAEADADAADDEEDDGLQPVLDAIDDLKAALAKATGTDNVADALEELRANYLDISDKLIEISEKIAEEPAEDDEETSEDTSAVLTAEDVDKTLEDLEYIRSKLDDQDLFISQISDMRSDILGISGTIDFSEQFNALNDRFESVISEITAQCDKLYEDMSNILIESETNIINRISESTVITDAVADSKADILADTQAIKDSVAQIQDILAALPLGDAVDQLRNDVLNLSDQISINADAAMTDRQKILDDIAFLREQAEAALAEDDDETVAADPDEKSPEELEREKLYSYLDDLSARVDLLTTLPDTVNDSISTVNDGIATVNTGVNNISADVAAVRDTATSCLDALAPITDRINEIIERLDNADARNAEVVEQSEEEDRPDAVLEELNAVKDDLDTILDTLPLLPQNDDLITARDNTYSILDSLTLMPQSDDVIAARDNIAAVLDAVNALSDSIKNIAEGNVGTLTEDVAYIRSALPETMSEDLAVVRDNTSTMLDALSTLTQSQEDAQYIRQKLDESASETSDTLTGIMQDLGLVLDKLEAFEQTVTADKQEIVDTVSGIREEIHINELDETISAAGIDDETRDMLVNEIAEIRDRLANIETTAQNISDVNTTALDNINIRLDELQTAVATPIVQNDETVIHTLDDVNEKLNTVLDGLQGSSLETITADIADIKARIDGGEVTVADADGTPVIASESLQAIIDELAVIKEKIDAESEYDTVEEILSLRDDVKAARIVDQNEVSGELEAIKNELAAISSGTVLDEIRALRDDIAALGNGQVGESAPAPTDGELNLVLNEIVSLRDEVFAFKDEVMSATASVETAQEGTEEAETDNEDINNILDELGDLREAQGVLADSIQELKDVISRRTTLAAELEGNAEAVQQSNELNVVLDEIINLKNDVDGINDRLPIENIETLTKQIEELRDMVDALSAPSEAAENEEQEAADDLAEIRERLDSIAINTSSVDFAALSDKVDVISSAVDDLRLYRENAEIDAAVQSGEVSGSLAENLDSLRADMDDVKTALAAISPSQDVSEEIASLRAEIDDLRAENEALRREQNDEIARELRDIRSAISDMALSAAPVRTEDGDTSYAALIDEIKSLKNQITADRAAPIDAMQYADNAPLAEQLGEIRDEIAQLRSLTTVTAESGSFAEIAAIRNDIAELKDAIASPDSMYGLAEDVTAIKADVQTLKEEPDLGVINEILALRDEFQSLREQIEDVKRIAGETDKQSDDTILNEVQSLRDQLFAISMANVNDSASGETNYESYNNIILDELSSLRDQMDAAGSSEELKTVSDELAQLKSTIDKREELYDALADRVARLDSDATNNKILDELASLRSELANQRDADLTTLNFMSEMAHLLERQNSYIAQNTGTKITDEIESLKAELASSDAVAEEVAKLREIMTQSGNASDNDTILGELADLREELSSEKPSRENELILQEIARLRDEITALAEREPSADVAAAEVAKSDADLADSLSDLKDSLNEIAGIVEPEQKTKTPARKRSTSTKTVKRSSTKTSTKTSTKAGAKKTTGTKSAGTSTGTKRGRKPAAQKRENKVDDAAVSEEQSVSEINVAHDEDFEVKVDRAMEDLGSDDMSLAPTATTPSTKDTMDVADKLAQQVANKLVIEQLVEQLGDGGMSDEEVDEILRELPVELTTTALDDQSDKVRKLANQLVLNKLRNRLGGRNNNDSDK